MSNEILFNQETLEKINKGKRIEITGETMLKNTYVFEISAIAQICSWKYLENYPVNSGDFIFHNDIDADDFRIIADKDSNKILISIETDSPSIALEQIISSLFNEKSQEYSQEFGYSGWNLNCNLGAIENNSNLLVDINKYNVEFFKVEVA